jgi:membrane protein DedA with SNARE-associated domain
MTGFDSLTQGWRRLSRRRKVQVVLALLGLGLCVVAAVSYSQNSDGLSIVDPANPGRTYVGIFLLIALDAVVPIFPGETTLNAASTAAAQGSLDLVPVILMGFLGASVGDSALFWIARRSSRRAERQIARARSNRQVRDALAVMDSSAPLLIVGGRYVPGMRFVVNATMGLSGMPYRRFLPWSVLSGALWSVYTCVLAYNVGQALAGFPVASLMISGLVTTAVIGVVFVRLRRRMRAPAVPPAGPTG